MCERHPFMKPHCPECKSIAKPHSKITGLKGVKTLIVYCSQCGCILGAVEYKPSDDAGTYNPTERPDDSDS